MLQNKMQVYRTISSFFAQVETQFNTKIKLVRSDNGTEIIQCLSLFMNKGIAHQTSIVGRPQQNGLVERKHRHFLDVARALKFHAKLPPKFWVIVYSLPHFSLSHGLFCFKLKMSL